MGEGDLMTGNRFGYSGMKLKCVVLAASILLASFSLCGCFRTRSPRTSHSQAEEEVKPGESTEPSPTPSPTPTPDPKIEATWITGNDSETQGTVTGNLTDGYIVTVRNISGVELPSSGGPGTIWIYLIGSILLLGCGITLIARRRIRT